MFIPDPDFYPSRISDPGSKNSNKRAGWKKICCHTFLCSHKFHKIENYFSFEVLKKKILANFQRIIELFTPKIVTKLSKIWVWDPRSGIRKKPIPDPGAKKALDPGSQIRIRNTGLEYFNIYRAASAWGCVSCPLHLFNNIHSNWLSSGHVETPPEPSSALHLQRVRRTGYSFFYVNHGWDLFS
jgi:hypothetical protein